MVVGGKAAETDLENLALLDNYQVILYIEKCRTDATIDFIMLHILINKSK